MRNKFLLVIGLCIVGLAMSCSENPTDSENPTNERKPEEKAYTISIRLKDGVEVEAKEVAWWQYTPGNDSEGIPPHLGISFYSKEEAEKVHQALLSEEDEVPGTDKNLIDHSLNNGNYRIDYSQLSVDTISIKEQYPKENIRYTLDVVIEDGNGVEQTIKAEEVALWYSVVLGEDSVFGVTFYEEANADRFQKQLEELQGVRTKRKPSLQFYSPNLSYGVTGNLIPKQMKETGRNIVN